MKTTIKTALVIAAAALAFACKNNAKTDESYGESDTTSMSAPDMNSGTDQTQMADTTATDTTRTGAGTATSNGQ
jgi:hypothetical protein